MPSWPWELSPQQYASPLENRAQEWSQPMAKETGVAEDREGVIEVMVEWSPISSTESPMNEVLPIPSCPWLLSPQQVISPLSRIAQVCL